MPGRSEDGPDHTLLRSDPDRYLALVQTYVQEHPSDPVGYFRRHHAWERLGRRDLALKDLDHCLRLEPDWITFLARGRLLRDMGRYENAISDFNRAEAADPEAWPTALGPLYRADCYARLGNEAAALADCARLPDDHWTPGVFGTPAGDKHEVTAEIREIARRHSNRS
jgi:tetratricopeptide (TPR) repeat protein